MGSFIKEVGSRGDGGYSIKKIEMLPIADLFSRFGTPYYLKIDVEGYDQRIIDALDSLPYRPRFVSAEESGVRMIDSLSRLGASAFKLVDQTNHPLISLPNPPLEGRFSHHYFVSGSSGPFGEETPGDWSPYKMFRDLYQYRSEDGTGFRCLKGGSISTRNLNSGTSCWNIKTNNRSPSLHRVAQAIAPPTSQGVVAGLTIEGGRSSTAT
jgi:hypothetical protein